MTRFACATAMMYEIVRHVADKKLFAHGQKEPMEVGGTFVAELVCESSGEEYVDEFTVIKGTGKPLLRKGQPFVWGTEQQLAFEELKRLTARRES